MNNSMLYSSLPLLLVILIFNVPDIKTSKKHYSLVVGLVSSVTLLVSYVISNKAAHVSPLLFFKKYSMLFSVLFSISASYFMFMKVRLDDTKKINRINSN